MVGCVLHNLVCNFKLGHIAQLRQKSDCCRAAKALGAVLDAWLLTERNKAKRTKQTKVHMHESTLLIWHVHCVKRRQLSTIITCVALMFYIKGLFLFTPNAVDRY